MSLPGCLPLPRTAVCKQQARLIHMLAVARAADAQSLTTLPMAP